ncbi:MAG: PQQ-binding-like beta-propeller repeat protein [Acidobacteriota bacterium]
MTDAPTLTRPRLWPAWIILGIQLVGLVLTITPSLQNGLRFGFMMLGPAVCFVLFFLVWLLFLSRMRWVERLLIFFGAIAILAGAVPVVDPTMRVALWIYGVPLTMLAIVVALRLHGERPRRVGYALGGVAVVFVMLATLRLTGFTGDYLPEFQARWVPAPKDTLSIDTDLAAMRATWQPEGATWPGFRGPDRNGITDVEPPADWQSAHELWRIDLGPAWSSFAYASGRLFTQEQRGDQEMLVAYDADTGEPIWQYAYPALFDEVVSGAGPRATPTVAADRVFAQGATGIFSAVDARTGELAWQRDLVTEYDATLQQWGLSSSPLVVDDLVIVYAGGRDDYGLLAYDVATGEPRWNVATPTFNFSSPQLVELEGERQIVFADRAGMRGLTPSSGDELWSFTPSEWGGPPMTQVQQIGPTSLIAPLGDGTGTARLDISRDEDGWSVREIWTGNRLKPSFNDFIHHDGYLYGFDQNIFACIDAATGERQWKRGRYGFGQVILLGDQLVIAAENGDIVVLAADPTEHRELARIDAVDGKTWNHPIAVDGRLYLRSGTEAVALDLGSRRTRLR